MTDGLSDSQKMALRAAYSSLLDANHHLADGRNANQQNKQRGKEEKGLLRKSLWRRSRSSKPIVEYVLTISFGLTGHQPEPNPVLMYVLEKHHGRTN